MHRIRRWCLSLHIRRMAVFSSWACLTHISGRTLLSHIILSHLTSIHITKVLVQVEPALSADGVCYKTGLGGVDAALAARHVPLNLVIILNISASETVLQLRETGRMD
jgi:hypothetical protein